MRTLTDLENGIANQEQRRSSLLTRQTHDPFKDWPEPLFELRGGVAEAYFAQEREVLLSGPAGTGKSLAMLLKLYWVCRKYPNARCLLLRKTRASLSESTLVTWERDILGFSHPMLMMNPNLRETRKAYRFPNGSTIIVGGLDRPDKTLSSEYDIIYVNEATEVEDAGIWETLQRALRSKKVPYQQIIADCNPTTPKH